MPIFLTSVKLCGRKISGDGIVMDPTRLQSSLDLSLPRTGADLQEFVCAANWMQTVIPKFTKVIELLAKLLENVY